jgi:hypothetical protein
VPGIGVARGIVEGTTRVFKGEFNYIHCSVNQDQSHMTYRARRAVCIQCSLGHRLCHPTRA